MKLLKHLAAAALVAGAIAGSASAQTTIHIVGSTAFRGAVQAAVLDVLGSNARTAYWGNSDYYKCQGSIVLTSSFVVETYWTGSAAGATDLAKQNSIPAFMSGTYSTLAASGTGTYISVTPGFDTSNPKPDVAMTDAYYKSDAKVMSDAQVSGTTNGGPALAAAISGAAFVDAGSNSFAHGAGTVGVIPFEWVLGNPGSIATTATNGNMTQQAARDLLTGYLNMSEITGSSADLSNFALLVGRNEDSGTRVDTFAETQGGFGVAPNQVLASFTSNAKTTSAFPQPNYGVQTGGNGSSLALLVPWTGGTGAYLNTEPTISWAASGHSGYVSGGDVANVLLAKNNSSVTVDPGFGLQTSSFFVASANGSGDYIVNTGTGGNSNVFLIGYLGIADAVSALSGNSNGNAYALSYNGVPYSVSNVQNGLYTLWGYEHMYYLNSASTTVKTFANAVADKIYTADADWDSVNAVHATGESGSAVNNAAGIFFTTMNFGRTATEGGSLSSE